MNTIKVGYLGPGNCTFGYQAFLKAFTKDSDIARERPRPIEFPSHQAICQAVGNLEIDYGVVGVENVIDGVVPETVRAIESVHAHLGIAICGEITVPVELLLMSKTGERKAYKRLLSHPSGLGQCRGLVSKLQAQGVTIEARTSTGKAAEDASLDPESAALASRLALSKYSLTLVEPDNMVDHSNSMTRFWILGKQHAKKSKGDVKYKTSFLVNLEQSAPGGLHQTQGVFAKHGINVLLPYPIPILGKRWEYTFLFEVAGHITDEALDRAWHDFQKLGISLQPMQFLGSYVDSTTEAAN